MNAANACCGSCEAVLLVGLEAAFAVVLDDPDGTPSWDKAWLMAEAKRPPFADDFETRLASLSPSPSVL
ncbi:MAG TPA: hypothetical protein DCQ77_01940 [Betaproteobacteria bacterium]|nr:hypothetical protein [Betaproteobacteria bacterium]